MGHGRREEDMSKMKRMRFWKKGMGGGSWFPDEPTKVQTSGLGVGGECLWLAKKKMYALRSEICTPAKV
jgi:hypothetical protein